MTRTDQDNDLVLLGAGASIDAGLPSSLDLTQRIAHAIEARGRYTGEWRALNAVVGAMISHDAWRGDDVFSGVDVERVFSAVRALVHRDDAELAPFVAAWNPSLASVGGDSFSVMDAKNLRDAIGKDAGTPWGNNVRRVLPKIVRNIMGAGGPEKVFSSLQDSMLEALEVELNVDPRRVDYLAPLLNANSEDNARIVTLNYDHSIELLAQRAGRSVTTGFDRWTGGYDWAWDNSADIRLLKMHGSLGWRLGQRQTEDSQGPMPSERLFDEASAESPGLWSRGQPALVFGHGSKLRADGPFLSMFYELSRMLGTASRLFIVGYSFSDDHVDSAIGKWLSQFSEARVVVVNPSSNDWLSDPRSTRTPKFVKELISAYGVRTPDGKIGLDPRIEFVASTAAEALPSLLGTGPLLSELPDASTESEPATS